MKILIINGAENYDTTRHVDGWESLIGLDATH